MFRVVGLHVTQPAGSRQCFIYDKGKGKVIPLQARCGPEGG